MNEQEAQRFLDEQRFQAELPFPVSVVFTHFIRSSTKNYALRALQLVAAAQSTIRYASMVAVCDYVTSLDADETVLNWFRQDWFGVKKPSFGTWHGSLLRFLVESGKSWKHPFVPEFAEIDRELLEKKIQPLIHSRNVEIGHAEYYEALAPRHFVELQEENLFAVMEQFSFLARYLLAFAEVEEDSAPPIPGTRQAINICRGASHNFTRYTVVPSHPFPPRYTVHLEPRVYWNPNSFALPHLRTGDNQRRAAGSDEGVSHIQGLLVLNGVQKGAPVYTSVGAEAQFSLEAFEFPPKEKIQEQVESTLKKGRDIPVRREARLSPEEQELLVRSLNYVEPIYEKEHTPH